MIFEKKGNLNLYLFESFEEYLDRASNGLHKKKPVTRYASKWGTKTFQEALIHARQGWKETTESIMKWADMIVGDISSQLPKPELSFDKIGSFWDLGRIIDGDPDCWTHEEPGVDIDREGRGNIVRMVINTASSAAVRSNSHKHRCGAVMALTQLLEKSGFYVQFEITTAIQVGGSKLEFRTVAKRPGEALNIAAVSFWASEYMERQIDFAICETMNECAVRDTWHSTTYNTVYTIDYGRPIYTHDPGDICFDRMYAVQDGVNWNNEQSVRQYIIHQLKKQGILISN